MKDRLLQTAESLVLVAVALSMSQGALRAAADDEVLTNDVIVELHQMGFGEEIIIGKIENTPSRFDVGLEALRELRDAGLSDSVIAAMIQASSSELAEQPDYDPNDPLAPHSPGIYVYSEDSEGPKMIKLEPSVYTQAKSGGFLKSAFTGGIAKIKSRAVLPGVRSRNEITDSRPIFYFYFEITESGLSHQAHATTSPAEFVLAEFTVKEKKNSRELVVGQMNAFGAQSGALDKTVRPFDFEEVAEGVYKVILSRPLPPGEYCFYYAGASPLPTYGQVGAVGGSKVFDFAIR